MKPPKTIKLRVLKKLLARYDVHFTFATKHPMFAAPDGTKFPIPYTNDGDDVERSYVNAARRAFGLAPDNGISDEEFYRMK